MLALMVFMKASFFLHFHPWNWSRILWIMSVGWKIINWYQVLCRGLWLCEWGDGDEEGDLEARTHRVRGWCHCQVWRVSRTFSRLKFILVTEKELLWYVWQWFCIKHPFARGWIFRGLYCLRLRMLNVCLQKVHGRHLWAEEKTSRHQPRDLSGRVGQRQGFLKNLMQTALFWVVILGDIDIWDE